MKAILTGITVAITLGCAGAPEQRARSQSPRSDTTALLVVDRPTAIGFFPPAKDSTEAAEDGYSEGIAHVGFALDDAKACLGHDSLQTLLVVDTAVRVQVGGRVDTLRFSQVDSLSYGVYLIAPDDAPHLVTAAIGPSALGVLVPDAIPAYFHRPPCRAGDAS